jgi:hypothetical protein
MQYKVTPYSYKGSDTFVAYKVENIFNELQCKILHDYYKNFGLAQEVASETLKYYDENSHSYGFGGKDILGISILENLTPMVSQILGRTVLPTYSYTRVYEKNTQLMPHRDRDACEISMSLTLENFPITDKEEKFYISRTEKQEEDTLVLSINTGDGLIFFGGHSTDGFYHWRDKTESDYLMQIFLHWVYADGEYTHEAYEYKR